MTGQSLVVRHCHADDLWPVLAIHSAHGNRVDGPPTEVESTTWATMMRREGLTVYIAEMDREPVGTASMLLLPNLTYGCAPTAFIEGVIVAPEKRRLGVATTMLRSMVDDATRWGVDKLQLLAHKRHATDGAHTLYASLGFVPEAEGFRRYLRAPRPRSG